MKSIKNEDWVWVIMLPEGDYAGQLLGLKDEKNNIWFIPTFMEKDDAWRAMGRLSSEKSKKYEPQAIIYEDLVNHCAENNFLIFILNADGEILNKIDPK